MIAPPDRPGDRWQHGFWDAVARGAVAVQRCVTGHLQFPGGPVCGTCGQEVAWTRVSGRGTVWSWAVFHQPYFDEFRDHLPYTVLLVELDEGPRIYTGVHPDEQGLPAVGTRVQLEVADYPFGPVPLARLDSS